MEVMRHRRVGSGRGLLIGAAGALLAACASTPPTSPARPATEGDTSYRSVAKDDLQHYQLALGEISTGAVPYDHAAPVYPPGLLEARLPAQEVEARLIIDAQGKVSAVRIEGEAQADPQRRQFAAAVRTAAMQWTFEPLRISRWAADANGNTHEVGSETRPFGLDYVFRFAWKDGKPSTETSAATAAKR